MATDEADDEKAGSGDAPVPTEPAANPSPGPRRVPHDGTAEWTASDARGPLVTADADRAPLTGHEDHVASGEPAVAVETPPDEPAPAADPITDHASPSETPAPVAAGPTPADSGAPASGRPADEPKKRSLLPLAAGIVIGALIGAGSAAIVYSEFGGAPAPDPMVASLSARVEALEKRPAPTADTGLRSAVADLESKVTTLEKRAGASPAQPASPPATADLITPLQQKIVALQAGLDALKTQGAATKDLGSRIAAVQGDLAGVQTKLAALQGDVAAAKTASATNQASLLSVAGEQKLLSGKISMPGLAVVADGLVQKIDQGQPYAVEVDALAALGADPAKIAVLRQNAEAGVPSAKTLAAKFEPLAEPIAATAHKAPPNAGFVDRLKTGMFSMVSVRSVDDTSGTDLPSRVARIQTDLAHDDIADALATWDALPADAKAKGEAWGALVKTSVEAMTAARALQHDAIVALGAKKS